MKLKHEKQHYAGGDKLGGGLCVLILSYTLFQYKLLSDSYSLLVLLPLSFIGLGFYIYGFKEMLKEKGYRSHFMLVLALMNLIGVIILALLPDKDHCKESSSEFIQ